MTDASLRASMGDPSIQLPRIEPEFWIDAHDVPAMIALQDRIEAGGRFVIPAAPKRTEGDGALVPIASVA